MTTNDPTRPNDERTPDEALLRARLKQALRAMPPDDLVAHVRSLAISGAGAPQRNATSRAEVALNTTTVSRRRASLEAWAGILPPVLGIALLVSLVAGFLEAFPPVSLLSRVAGLLERSTFGPVNGAVAGPGSGALVPLGLLLLTVTSAAFLALLADVTRGAPTLRRFIR